jgi:type 1 fimbria pilin
MNKIVIASIATLATCLTANIASAQTSTETITVSGTIAPETTMSVTQASTINLKAGSQRIADISVNSNVGGKKVKLVFSAPNGCVLRGDNGKEIGNFQFALNKGDGAFAPFSASNICSDQTETFDVKNSLINEKLTLALITQNATGSAAGQLNAPAAGTYTGLFTLTLSVEN